MPPDAAACVPAGKPCLALPLSAVCRDRGGRGCPVISAPALPMSAGAGGYLGGVASVIQRVRCDRARRGVSGLSLFSVDVCQSARLGFVRGVLPWVAAWAWCPVGVGAVARPCSPACVRRGVSALCPCQCLFESISDYGFPAPYIQL